MILQSTLEAVSLCVPFTLSFFFVHPDHPQIATAFIHLLDPAIEELTSPCLDPSWQVYVSFFLASLSAVFSSTYLPHPQPYALAFALISIFGIFIVEIIAFRWGTAKLAKLGLSHGT